MNKRRIYLLAFVLGGLAVAYLFQIQLMFWAANAYSPLGPWNFINRINVAGLSAETELTWRMRRIRANWGDPFALQQILSVAGMPGPQSHGLESTPGDRERF